MLTRIVSKKWNGLCDVQWHVLKVSVQNRGGLLGRIKRSSRVDIYLPTNEVEIRSILLSVLYMHKYIRKVSIHH